MEWFLMWFCNIIIRTVQVLFQKLLLEDGFFCPKQTFLGKCHFSEAFINQGWQWKEIFLMKWHSPGLQMEEVWVLVLHDHLLHDKAAFLKNSKCLRAERAELILQTWGLISLEEHSDFCSASCLCSFPSPAVPFFALCLQGSCCFMKLLENPRFTSAR